MQIFFIAYIFATPIWEFETQPLFRKYIFKFGSAKFMLHHHITLSTSNYRQCFATNFQQFEMLI